jgi:hypothetical protein
LIRSIGSICTATDNAIVTLPRENL